MQVILIDDIARVGNKGEIVKVREGYARNFLFPRNMAIPVSKGSMTHRSFMEKSWQKHSAKKSEKAQEVVKILESMTLKVHKKAGEKGRLFGSVTTTELAELIGTAGKVQIDKHDIATDHLKELGEHTVVVKFSGEIKANVKVVVLPEELAGITKDKAATATKPKTFSKPPEKAITEEKMHAVARSTPELEITPE